MQCGKEEYKKTALSVANRKVSLKVKPCALPLEMFLLVCLPFGWARLLSSTIYLRFGKLYFRSGLPTFSATGPSICPQLSFSCTSDQHNIRKTTRRILCSTTVVLIYTSKTTSDHNGLRNAMITYTVNLHLYQRLCLESSLLSLDLCQILKYRFIFKKGKRHGLEPNYKVYHT